MPLFDFNDDEVALLTEAVDTQLLIAHSEQDWAEQDKVIDSLEDFSAVTQDIATRREQYAAVKKKLEEEGV